MKLALRADRSALALLTAAALAMNLAQPPRAVAASCKQARSCEEAVAMWCEGYKRADGDGDGIPCENVCHSLDQVQKIREENGC